MIAGREGNTIQWSIVAAVPDSWAADLSTVGGGFFHTPIASKLNAQGGAPFFAFAKDSSGVIAIAAGARKSCSLDRAQGHFTLSSPPAVRRDRDYAGLTEALAEAIRRSGGADCQMNSFDARSAVAIGQTQGRLRIEHVVPLKDISPDLLLSRFSSNHRKHVRAGTKQAWSFAALTGDQAETVLLQSQLGVAARKQMLGESVSLNNLPASDLLTEFRPDASWGLSCFAVMDGDQALSAAIVGWANGKAYDVMSGSTSAGYQRRAAFWLQWKIMCTLAAAGYSDYNMGGTSQVAGDTSSPGSGLFQYKQGYGAEQLECRGGYWAFQRAHVFIHRALKLIRRQA